MGSSAHRGGHRSNWTYYLVFTHSNALFTTFEAKRPPYLGLSSLFWQVQFFPLMCLSGALPAEFIPLVRSIHPSWMAYIIQEGRGKCIRYLLLKFTPGCVRRHCFQFNNTTPCDEVQYMQTVCGGEVVGLFWRQYTAGLLHSMTRCRTDKTQT